MSSPESSAGARPLPPVVRFGRCELQLESRVLLLDGTPQPVRRRVFDLIVYLLQHRPRTVPHKELLRAVWQRTHASPSLVSRAVMEARRAIGDSGAEAHYIVSLHGVGYRFAGTAGEQARQDESPTAADAAGEEVAALRALVARARQAIVHGQLDLSEQLADEVMARAEALGSHSEKVEALLLQSSVALNRLDTVTGAQAAARALQIARAEGYPPLVAKAQVGCGAVHVLGGDLEIALRHLREALTVLEQPGQDPAELIRGLMVLSLALYRQGELEAALAVCRRIGQLPPPGDGTDYKAFNWNNEVLYSVALADRETAQGRTERARELYEHALQLNERHLQEQQAAGDRRRSCVMLLLARSTLLERLDRLDEAWSVLEGAKREFRKEPEAATQPGGMRPEMWMVSAWLMARRGLGAQALEAARTALDQTVRLKWVFELDGLYQKASEVAELAGDHAQALRWQRERCEQLLKMRRERSASLAAMLIAEMNVDELRAELDAARATSQRLLEENDALRSRLATQDRLLATARIGASHAPVGVSQFRAAHERARAAGVPMRVGLLTLSNAATPAGKHPATDLDGVWPRVFSLLRASPDIVHPAVSLGEGRALFRFRDAALADAQAVCRDLESALARLAEGDAALAEAPRWQLRCTDASQAPSIEEAVAALAREHDTR